MNWAQEIALKSRRVRVPLGGASVTLIERARSRALLTGLWFFPFAKTYYNPLTIARDIF